MWRNLILASTTAAALFTGTAFAFASPPEPDAPASESTAQLDHRSQMRIEMDDQWAAMVDHMDGTFGIRFPEMIRAMELYDPRMNGVDMEDFMNGVDMEDFMGQSGMGGPA